MFPLERNTTNQWRRPDFRRWGWGGGTTFFVDFQLLYLAMTTYTSNGSVVYNQLYKNQCVYLTVYLIEKSN